MFLIVGLMAFMIMHIQKVLSQNNLTFAKDTIDPLQCEKPLELRCTYIGGNPCCTSSNRIWRVNEQPVMTNGILSTGVVEGKYQEGKISDTYFILIISNLEKADLEKAYSCKYGFDDLKDSIVVEWSCISFDDGMEAFGNAVGGTGIVVTVFVFVIVVFIIKRRKHVNINQVMKRLAVALPVYLATSMLLNFLIAPTVGTYEKIGPWWIAVGLVTGIVGIAVGYMFDKIGMSDTDSQQTWPPWIKVKDGAKFVPLLILTAVEIIIIGVVVLIVIGKYFKGQCNKCGGIAFGWAILGPLVPVIVFIILKLKKGLNLKRSILFGCLIFWRSLVVNVVVAVSFGIYLCPCTDYKDVAFICVGLFYSLILIAVFWCLFDTEEDKLLIVLLFFGGLEICLAIFFCVAYCKSSKGGKSQSVESGSPEKERADKKKERKPTEVVRPQPHRALPPMTQHLGTENTRRAEFSTETEMYKPRPLPSISGQSDSPRPLPKRTPDDLEKSSVQLKPLGDSISEKKKKKKRKKKETKLSDEDD